MNFSSLCLDIAEWMMRDDIDRVAPSFISKGQRALEDDLRLPAMEYLSSGTTHLPKGSNSINLPADYLEVNYICFTDQLPTPVNAAFTSGAGTLAAGAYYYRVSAVNAYGETLASAETSITLGAQGGINVNWTKVDGATGYKVYGRSTGNEKLIATVGDVATYLDGGSVTPAGSLPALNSTGKTRYKTLDRMNNREFIDLSRSNIDLTNTGKPVVFARVGDKLYFDKFADQDYVYEFNYYRRLETLSGTNQTNWWTENAEEALLLASLVAAIPFLGDDPRSGGWQKALDKAVERIRHGAIWEMSSGGNRNWGSVNVF